MDVLIRVDSSHLIGYGHIMRCLTLARKLRDRGFNVAFIGRKTPGNFNFLSLSESFEFFMIPSEEKESLNSTYLSGHYGSWLGVSQEQDARDCQRAVGERKFDWVIVDHYALDYVWQDSMRSIVSKIMVIDDLANRNHNCEILLDQNFYENKEDRYISLIPKGCVTLLGPSYLLVPDQYNKYQSVDKIRTGSVTRVLVFFGSIDQARQTETALAAITQLDRDKIFFDVIVGLENQQKDMIQNMCANLPNVHFHCQVNNMWEFIYNADLALGAGGATGWERCKLGLPTITTIVADNQIESTQNAERIGAIVNLGHYSKVRIDTYLNAIRSLINSPHKVKAMSKSCLDIFENSKIVDIPNLFITKKAI